MFLKGIMNFLNRKYTKIAKKLVLAFNLDLSNPYHLRALLNYLEDYKNNPNTLKDLNFAKSAIYSDIHMSLQKVKNGHTF